jgi:hypothetical protein
MESVSLGSVGKLSCLRSEGIGVVTRWQWPTQASFTDGVTGEQLQAIKDGLKPGACRKDAQATEWVGFMVGDILGLGSSEETIGWPRQAAYCQNGRCLAKDGELRIYEEPINGAMKQFVNGAMKQFVAATKRHHLTPPGVL